MPEPIATDAQGAMDFLGVSKTRWGEIRRRIPKLGQDWYAYDDLRAFLDGLRRQRDNGKILEGVSLEVSEGEQTQEPAAVGGERDRPRYPKTEELLRRHAR